jgi:hypothetical protein
MTDDAEINAVEAAFEDFTQLMIMLNATVNFGQPGRRALAVVHRALDSIEDELGEAIGALRAAYKEETGGEEEPVKGDADEQA